MSMLLSFEHPEFPLPSGGIEFPLHGHYNPGAWGGGRALCRTNSPKSGVVLVVGFSSAPSFQEGHL